MQSVQERCMNCGDCVTVFPIDALTLHPTPHTYPGCPSPVSIPDRQSPEDLQLIRPDPKAGKEQMDQLLVARRTHGGLAHIYELGVRRRGVAGMRRVEGARLGLAEDG